MFIMKHISMNYGNIKKDGFHPQGYINTKEFVLISAYYRRRWFFKRLHSRIYCYSKKNNKLVGIFVLPSFAHVGGIALDEDHKVLFVTDRGGKIKSYRYDKMIGYLNQSEIKINFSGDRKEKGIRVDDEEISLKNNIHLSNVVGHSINASTITFYQNHLYAATFGYRGLLVQYELNYQKNKLTATGKLISDELPGAIQGITFYKKDRNTYFITSQSYGGKKHRYGTRSSLKRYLFLRDKLYFKGQKVMDYYYSEGICCDQKGCITSIHEMSSGSTNQIISTSFQELTEEWDENLELSYQKGVDVFKL